MPRWWAALQRLDWRHATASRQSWDPCWCDGSLPEGHAQLSARPVPHRRGAHLLRTNNDLEHLFGSQRYHERRATGRKTASPSAVLRGSVRLIAATATRVCAPSAQELGAANREHWRSLRQRLEKGRQARTLRTRFRHDPAAYLAALEPQVCQLTLPS